MQRLTLPQLCEDVLKAMAALKYSRSMLDSNRKVFSMLLIYTSERRVDFLTQSSSLLLSSGGSESLTLPSCDRMNGKSKLKEIKGGFTFPGWGTVIAGTGIVLGGNSSRLKALQENLASFEMMTE